MSEVVFTIQELKMGIMILLLSLFFVFSGGYFLGKKRAIDELVLHYNDECFADKIQQSLSLFCDNSESSALVFAPSDAIFETSGDQENEKN